MTDSGWEREVKGRYYHSKHGTIYYERAGWFWWPKNAESKENSIGPFASMYEAKDYVGKRGRFFL